MLFYGIVAIVIFVVGRWVYRLTLHPLARFPGPKLAAMSSMYAMSWDLPVKTSYVKQFATWHDKYGPIIRIEPNHLHIRDVDAYNEVFKIGTKFDRDPAIYGFAFTRGSFLNKLSVREAKPHRDMYSPYFSRSAVVKLETIIREHLCTFLTKVEKLSSGGSPVDLTRGYRCLSADTVMRYCYNKSYGALDSPEFKYPMLESLEPFFDNATIGWYFPNLMNRIVNLIKKLPRSWIEGFPPFAAAIDNLNGCTARIAEMQREPPDPTTVSVFRTALNPNIEKGQPVLSLADLGADALVVYTAGTDTTTNTLVTGTWGLLCNREQMRKLQQELREALPYRENFADMDVDWIGLEKLESLRNVIKEALRLSYGIPGKAPRIVPANGAILCGRAIPGGTAVSMSCYVYHHDRRFFNDEPEKFKPERWADKSAADLMDKAWIPFSRGSRSCIGTNLAYAQLYYTFAYFFRNFDIEAFETTADDMDWHDAFVVATFGHLKIKARRVVEYRQLQS